MKLTKSEYKKILKIEKAFDEIVDQLDLDAENWSQVTISGWVKGEFRDDLKVYTRCLSYEQN